VTAGVGGRFLPSASPSQDYLKSETTVVHGVVVRMAIGRELDEQGITTPAAIGVALGMPATEATSLLTRRQWREGDVARLQAAAARLGVKVPAPASWPWPG
jgi:hypothetical protein